MQHWEPHGLSRRTVLLAPLSSLVGCATPTMVKEGQPITSGQAHILIRPQYRFGSSKLTEVDIGLTRVDGNSKEDLQLVAVPTDDVSVLEVKPGVYYLRRLESSRGYYKHTIDPRMTLFNARSGQLNYPGDWRIDVQVLAADVKGTLGRGSLSTEYGIKISVYENPEVATALQTKYPGLNAALPLRLTRIRNPDPS